MSRSISWHTIPMKAPSRRGSSKFRSTDMFAHPELKTYPVADLPPRENNIGPDTAVTTPLQRFLEELHQQRQRNSLVLLVRPNGIASFQRIYGYLCDKYPHPQSPLLDMGIRPRLGTVQQRWTLISKKLKP